MPKQKLKFPKGFLWGAATSAYQVEGGIDNNDWAASDRVPKAGAACDQYRRYVEDFSLAKKLGHNTHRLSLEWSRIEPEQGQFDDRALYHYHNVLTFLKSRSLTTFVTLHHFTNPLWFARRGGWASPKAPKYFENYVAKVCQSLGHLVDFWLTINEPKMYAGMGYMQAIWPPFKSSLIQARRVYNHMLSAHNRGYKVIHSYYPEARVGFSQNIGFSEAEHKNPFEKLAIRFADWLNYTALEKTKYDFIGLNHYFYYRVHLAFSLKNYLKLSRGAELTERGWAIYPEALYRVLKRLAGYQKPIYITENGIADSSDSKRVTYIRNYLAAVHQAISEGVDVRGYLHWSLLDNFEWEAGYKWKFGLVEVDFKTQKRTVRPSALAYAEICRSNSIHLSLQASLEASAAISEIASSSASWRTLHNDDGKK